MIANLETGQFVSDSASETHAAEGIELERPIDEADLIYGSVKLRMMQAEAAEKRLVARMQTDEGEGLGDQRNRLASQQGYLLNIVLGVRPHVTRLDREAIDIALESASEALMPVSDQKATGVVRQFPTVGEFAKNGGRFPRKVG